ncbi:MAG TPA: insulinase family protein [Planctomycetaceae bacterium]|nr:insulinase family protein [Planctomycetaceae bacterium]
MSTFRHATLSNGLKIAAEIDPRGYSASFGYFVRTGSRDETDIESGCSHFLEHMMFKGTAKRSAADVNRELDELGGNSNAFTSEEQTVYYATVLPKYQDRIIDLLSDMMRPSLRQEDFDTERKVILEEIAKYEDQPPFGAFERVMERYFGPRGIGRRILGTSESIVDMSRQTMYDYFTRRYAPGNIVLAAAGNVDFDGLVAMVERLTSHWGDLVAAPAPPPDDASALPVGIATDPLISSPDAAQAYLVQIGPAPGGNDLDRYPARLLSSILGDDSGSRLFWELIDTGRAESCSLWTQEFMDVGALFTMLVCDPDDLSSNRRIVEKTIKRLLRDGVSQEELDQAINKAVAGCIMSNERPSNRMFEVGSDWQLRGEYTDLDKVLERYRGVNVDEIGRIADKYLTEATVETLATAEPLTQPT